MLNILRKTISNLAGDFLWQFFVRIIIWIFIFVELIVNVLGFGVFIYVKNLLGYQCNHEGGDLTGYEI